MPTIKELREEQARILAAARSKYDEITAQTPAERAAEIEREHDKAMADHDAIGERVKRLERMEAAERALQAGDDRRPQGADSRAEGQARGEAGVTYRQAFAKYVCGVPTDMMTPSERSALMGGSVNSTELRAQVVGTASAGGYTVPTELMQEIDIALVEGGPMWDASVIRVLQTASGHTMTMPTIDDTASTAEAHTEGAEVTNDGGKDVTVGQKSLEAYAYDSEWIRWSWILDNDSDFAWEGILGQLIGERLSRKANALLTTGSGSGEPNGIVTAAGLGKTAAGVAAVTADEVIEFVHSINPAYRKAPKFGVQFNDTTLLALRKLKDGDGNYLIREAPDGMGRMQVGAVTLPYHINPDMASMGASNRFMVAGDFGRYIVRKAGSPILFVAREKFAPNLGILGLIRFDGELANTGAVKAMRNAAS
jgi:HK97 family phage major capsid protein